VSTRRERARRLPSLILGAAALAVAALLLAQDAAPRLLPAESHRLLAAASLAMIALAYAAFKAAHQTSPVELAKAALVAAAFLFWAANQFWPNLPQAALCNDAAIGLFVADAFLVIASRPAREPF
jgi:peptidoglycan/LPS O-acetylase OafA/YrhL